MTVDTLQNGRYRQVRLLGSGGMGEVHLMQDTRVSRQVAIKVTLAAQEGAPATHADSDAHRLFQREARAIAALDHPNILPLYDFGEETSGHTTITYLVMPYCANGSLEDWLRQRPQRMLAPQDVAYLVEQAAEALQYAHEQNIMHLDVKPSNFLLRANRKNPDRLLLLLADFGIARNFTTVASASRTIRGTPTAMAPEQWASTPVLASDQYALAVMAYELLAGRPPFIGSMEQLMYQHFAVPPLPPSAYNSLLPAALDVVMLRALAKKPEERFPSVTDFASALTQVAQGLSAAPAMRQEASSGYASVQATLLISQAEAEAGVSRLITLPSGGQMVVPIPAGVSDGQVMRLANPDSARQGEAIVLTIAINNTGQAGTPAQRVSGEQARETPRSGMQALPADGLAHSLPTVSAFDSRGQAVPERSTAGRQPPSRSRWGLVAVLSIAVVILLIAGTGFWYISHQSGSPSLTPTTSVRSQTPTLTASPTTPAPARSGLYIAGTYNGSMFDETTNQTSFITVVIVQTRGNATLSGDLIYKSPSPGTHPLSGTDDPQGAFSFSVQQTTGQLPLYFFGTFQQADYLHGYFCSSSTNSCPTSTGTGYFTVGPRF